MNRAINTENVEEYRSFRLIAEERRKKKQKTFIQHAIVLMVCILLLILGFVLFLPSAEAGAESMVSYEKRIVSVQVVQNDTLWNIAERFYCKEKESIPEFVRSIKKTNHLEGDTIYPDTYLVIQYYVKKPL